jgi:antitoxin CcdA
MPRSSSPRQQKRAVNVSVSADIVDEARRLGTNISAVVEKALVAENLDRQRDRWRAANRAAIEEANQELDDNGLWSDGLRTF